MIRRYSKWFIFILAIVIFAAAVLYVLNQIRVQANRPAPVKEVEEQHPDVSVVTVQGKSYEAIVTGYGAAYSHFELTLTAQVAGQVDTLAEAFEPGQRLKKGELLAQLEDSDYKAAVAEAKQNLSEARLALIEEQRQALQAKAEWKASGLSGKPDSSLVLRQPQLAAAKAAATTAEAALVSANKNLSQTRITAPFDALVVERLIAPGSYLQTGAEIATLYSTDRVEIAVSLSSAEWDQLPALALLNSGHWPVELNNVQNDQSWSGRILRVEQHLGESTRQRKLILALDNPLDSDPPLLSGTFVKATIDGRRLGNVWKLPSSAYSQKGEIWYVKADNTLDSFSAEPQFSDAEYIFISPPDSLTASEQRVLVHPLSSYLQGMAVNPVEEANHE